MPALDHIVLLVPHGVLQALPAWLTGALTVIPGGQHAGGVTENQLVLFQDGFYIEIIAFVGGSGSDEEDTRRRRGHRWGGKPDGHIIDWAVGLSGTLEETDKEFSEIQKNVGAAGAKLAYKDLVAGGRTTPDGVVLKWATASPTAVPEGSEDVTGLLPFWCLDRTDRKLRVPYATQPELAQHPSGAIGVAGVILHISDEALVERLRKIYNVLFGESKGDEWKLAVPESSFKHAPTLKIAHDKTQQNGAGQGWIELALFSTGPALTVGSSFVEGWRVDILLVHVD
ncbi:hypothetical protein SEUCBS139899_002907 [Sporothrix eucalyptigena]